MYSSANLSIFRYDKINNKFEEINGTTNGITFVYNNKKISLQKLNKIKVEDDYIYSSNKDNIINYIIKESNIRNNLRRYIGTRQICWATVRYIDYKKHHLVLTKVKVGNVTIDHMNIFMHNFKYKKDYNKNIMNLNIGDRIKIRGIISSYIKIICNQEVEDYCFREFEFIDGYYNKIEDIDNEIKIGKSVIINKNLFTYKTKGKCGIIKDCNVKSPVFNIKEWLVEFDDKLQKYCGEDKNEKYLWIKEEFITVKC